MMLTQLTHFLSQHGLSLVALIALVKLGLNYRSRRIAHTRHGVDFFSATDLLRPPLTRPAYSDRMAYVLAEMSALAYFEFEKDSHSIKLTLDKMSALAFTIDKHYHQHLEEMLRALRNEMQTSELDGKAVLAQLLQASGFKLIDTILCHDTQGFVCQRDVANEPAYRVIAFRGSEKNVEDWLTNVHAKPQPLALQSKVHSGFWQALHQEQANGTGTKPSAIDQIKRIIATENAQCDTLPWYVTGHSLGGALAIITTKELLSNINGACYTFGSPRLANYEYFSQLKTPVFRVVNSADIVPRLPAGAMTSLALHGFKTLRFITQFIPQIKGLWTNLEKSLDDLDDYRHYGDLRYLSDVKSGRFADVKLLLNPPALDRIWWMYQQLHVSLKEPVASHGMAVYRYKLGHLAVRRNPRKPPNDQEEES